MWAVRLKRLYSRCEIFGQKNRENSDYTCDIGNRAVGLTSQRGASKTSDRDLIADLANFQKQAFGLCKL